MPGQIRVPQSCRLLQFPAPFFTVQCGLTRYIKSFWNQLDVLSILFSLGMIGWYAALVVQSQDVKVSAPWG